MLLIAEDEFDEGKVGRYFELLLPPISDILGSIVHPTCRVKGTPPSSSSGSFSLSSDGALEPRRRVAALLTARRSGTRSRGAGNVRPEALVTRAASNRAPEPSSSLRQV